MHDVEKLSDLTDCQVVNPITGETLVWDPNSSEFVNKPVYSSAGIFLETPTPGKAYPCGFYLVSNFALEDLAVFCRSGSGVVTGQLDRGGVITPIAGLEGVAVSTTPNVVAATLSLLVDDTLLVNIDSSANMAQLSVRYRIRKVYT